MIPTFVPSSIRMLSLALAAAAIATPALAQTSLTREQQIEDLTVLERRYIPAERALDPQERATAQALIAELKGRAGTMSDLQFYLGVLRVVAQADTGHSVGG